MGAVELLHPFPEMVRALEGTRTLSAKMTLDGRLVGVNREDGTAVYFVEIYPRPHEPIAICHRCTRKMRWGALQDGGVVYPSWFCANWREHLGIIVTVRHDVSFVMDA